MFQSKCSWLWRAQAASRNGASSLDAFFPNLAQNGYIFSTVGWIDISGFAPALSMLEDGDSTPPVSREAASVFPLSFSPPQRHSPSL